MSRPRVLVLGGGLAGLACALRLGDHAEVTLLEARPRVGGLAGSLEVEDRWIPVTYHHVMRIDHATRRFIGELGFGERLAWNRIRIAYHFEGREHLLNYPWDLALFRVLTPLERARLAVLGAEVSLRRDWSALASMPADRWIERRVGARTRELIFDRLAEIKFGAALSEVSAGWLGSRLAESVKNGQAFAYLEGGLEAWVQALAERVETRAEIRTGARVSEVHDDRVVLEGGESLRYDRLVSTLPPPALLQTSHLSNGLDPELESIRYLPIICSVFGARKVISPHYWNVYMQPKRSFGGLFNHTALYPPGGVDGEQVYYVFTYLSNTDDPRWAEDEGRWGERHRRDVLALAPDAGITWWRTTRIRYASPLFRIGYRLPPLRSRTHPSLYYGGVYMRFPATRTMSSALLSGEAAAQAVRADLGR